MMQLKGLPEAAQPFLRGTPRGMPLLLQPRALLRSVMSSLRESTMATAYAPEARARTMAANALLDPSSWPRRSWFLHSTKPRALTTPGYTVDYRRSWSPCVLSSAGAVFLAAFSCP